jgi:hypothetical protein
VHRVEDVVLDLADAGALVAELAIAVRRRLRDLLGDVGARRAAELPRVARLLGEDLIEVVVLGPGRCLERRRLRLLGLELGAVDVVRHASVL